MPDAAAVVSAFIDHINRMDIEGAIGLCAPGIVYHNIPMQPVVGPEGVRAVLGQIPCDRMHWIVHTSADHDGHVLNERTDRFRLLDGRWVELRVMGVFEVQESRITAWRDYFDLGQWMQQMQGA